MFPAISNAKANLTTVSYISSAPAVVAPVGQRAPSITTIISLREPSSKPSRVTQRPRVIKDVVVEQQIAAEKAAAKKAAVMAAQAKEAARKAAAKKVTKTSTKSSTNTVIRAGSGPTSKTNWATPGQCTWGAQVKWKNATGSYIGGFFGNALTWDTRAAAAGHSVGSTPRARSIVVLEPGVHGSSSYGHVAWVTSVSGNKVTYVEMNGMAGEFNWSTRTVSHVGGMRYIYAP